MEKYIKLINKHSWIGKPTVLIHHHDSNINHVMADSIFETLRKEHPNDFIFKIDLNDGDNSINIISRYIEMCNSNKAHFIIENLSSYKHPEAIINMFYDKCNINTIILSDYNIEKLLGKNATLCRGKYIRIFTPPSLYEYNDKFDGHLHIEFLMNERNYNDIYDTYIFILNNVGQKMSYNHIHKYVLKDRGLPYLIHIFNELVNYGIIYLLSNTNLKNETPMPNSGVTFYLTYPEDMSIVSNTSDLLKLENYAIAKLFNENYQATTVSMFMRYNKDNSIRFGNGLIKTFLFKKDNNKLLIKFDYGCEEEKNRFIKLKTNISKMIIYVGDTDYRIGNDNISYIGIYRLVKEGIKTDGKI